MKEIPLATAEVQMIEPTYYPTVTVEHFYRYEITESGDLQVFAYSDRETEYPALTVARGQWVSVQVTMEEEEA